MLTVRRFCKWVERGQHPMVSVSGEIREGHFEIRTFGKTVAVDIVEIFMDPRGPYALINEGEYPLGDGATLCIEAEPDDLLGDGTRISVDFAGLEQGFSVYLNASGHVDGMSSANPGPAKIALPAH